MPYTSVNTNTNAFVALQNLTATQYQLGITQNRVSTGLAVSSTKDDSAVYQIAQNLRSDTAGLSSINQSLNRAKSTLDTAINGAQSISDLLIQARTVAASAQDSGLDAGSRTALTNDFKAIITQINSVVQQSVFNGSNLLKANPDNISAITGVTNNALGAGSSSVSKINVAGFDAGAGSDIANIRNSLPTAAVSVGQSLSSLLTGTTGGQVAAQFANTAVAGFTTATVGVSFTAATATVATNTVNIGSPIDPTTGKLNVSLASGATPFAGGTINFTVGTGANAVTFTSKTSYAANTTAAAQPLQLSLDDFTVTSTGAASALTVASFSSTATNVAATAATANAAQFAKLDFANFIDRSAGLAIVDSYTTNLNNQLSTFGSASRQIDTQTQFAQKLTDTFNAGIGSLVDANLPAESAKLQGLNVRQQLGIQALSLANAGPQSLLSLFR